MDNSKFEPIGQHDIPARFWPLTEAEVIKLESCLGCKLPEDYRAFLLSFGECTISYDNAIRNEAGDVFDLSYFLGARAKPEEDYTRYRIFRRLDIYQDDHPLCELPIAVDTMEGNQYVFKVKEKRIVYRDYYSRGLGREKWIFDVANSFTELVERIVPKPALEDIPTQPDPPWLIPRITGKLVFTSIHGRFDPENPFGPMTAAEISEVEDLLECPLPEDYRKFLLEYGVSSYTGEIKLFDGKPWGCSFFGAKTLVNGMPTSVRSLLDNLIKFQEHSPKHELPIGLAGSPDKLYVYKVKENKIVVQNLFRKREGYERRDWEMEIANGFSDFLTKFEPNQ